MKLPVLIGRESRGDGCGGTHFRGKGGAGPHKAGGDLEELVGERHTFAHCGNEEKVHRDDWTRKRGEKPFGEMW